MINLENSFAHLISNYEDLIILLKIYCENLNKKNLDENFLMLFSRFQNQREYSFENSLKEIFRDYKNFNESYFELLNSIIDEPMYLKTKDLGFLNKSIFE